MTATEGVTAANRGTVMTRRELTDDPVHGPLPAPLIGLTLFTGLVDAVSILGLGRVFVANMTGNVVFVAFASAGVAGFHSPPQPPRCSASWREPVWAVG
jgi:hypothetical protein